MIDLNCDMGEGRTDDHLFMPFVQRCSIACGAHAGNPDITRKTITSALNHGLIIGAHPSYPDKENFGRKSIRLNERELQESVASQLEYIYEISEKTGATIQYLKAHGALYNDLAEDAVLADSFCQIVKNITPELEIVGLAGGELEQAAKTNNVLFIAEAFCDRRYEDDLTLSSREHPNALISNPAAAVKQLNEIALDRVVTTASGELARLNAATICIHSDTPNALKIAEAVYAAQQSW